jgi:hypothetical protein
MAPKATIKLVVSESHNPPPLQVSIYPLYIVDNNIAGSW